MPLKKEAYTMAMLKEVNTGKWLAAITSDGSLVLLSGQLSYSREEAVASLLVTISKEMGTVLYSDGSTEHLERMILDVVNALADEL